MSAAGVAKGAKRRKNYPLSWGAAPEKMKMKKRVLCVYEGQRRLWKDDMMLDADNEVRIPLVGEGVDGRAWITDLDVLTLRRAEGVLNATAEEKGPWATLALHPSLQPPQPLRDRILRRGVIATAHRTTSRSRVRAARWSRRESFDDIYLDLSKQSGKCRLAESGIGWKTSSATWTLDKTDIISAQWSRAAKGYEVKLIARTAGVVQLDGFRQEDFDTVQKCLKVWYGVEMVNREHALQGWNWGKSEMGRTEFAFSVRNKPAFEIPYTEISNTNLAGKNEVAVEFSLPADGEETGTNGHLGGARSKGRKTGGATDQLTEMRFYIPGTDSRKGKKKDVEEDGEEAEDDGEEEKNAATVFYETLMDKAEIGEVAGDTYATFLDILHLTPRGRFDIDLYEKSFRLRGKTYDYKVPYENAKRFFLLPKPDDMHQLLCIGLDPPLRQGQTRYPFIVMQFKREEEVNIELNMTDEDLKSKYNGKLQSRYEAPIFQVIAKIFHGLTNKKIFQPSSLFISHHGQSGVKCSIKANEGHLYCLDRAFLFVPKPATYISYEHVSSVAMSRVGGAISASRTFDITVTLKNGAGEHQLLNINREEQSPLETLFKAKNIPFRNEMDGDGGMMAAVMNNDPDLASSDEEVVEARGSADEDDESVDEDFQADDESDVAEEFDSDAASSGGGGSDAEMEDAAGAGSEGDTAAKVERPKKKAKTGK
ncbi:FACT complex subunit [Friedmanniomyces endolithicus]|nr:FACT complex subunit [Friedmanniomyces endolithicus]